ncbi:MAG: ThiF family adenylyltransferase [Phycisphaerales bacterium]|nr:ThiF family adenylyltransferase [Phycisphaerales bacterium]
MNTPPTPAPREPGPDRYSRQTRLPEVGEAGQGRLSRAHVLVVGCGALGCAASELLARAGVGRLTLVDRDLVEWSNLHRQVLFSEADARAGRPKALAGAARLKCVNSSIVVDAAVADLRASNVATLVPSDPSLVVDATDNFETRYLLNDLCVKRGLPLVYGGVIGVRGMQATFAPGGPCLRCVFPEPPEPGSQQTCESAGVLGPAVAVVGAMQAAAALRLIIGGEVPRLLHEWDVWRGSSRTLALGEPRADCPACAASRFEFLDARHGEDAARVCGSDAVQVWPAPNVTVDLRVIAEKLAPHGPVEVGPVMVRAEMRERPGVTLTVFADSRAIVRGAGGVDAARSLYARFVGC